MFYKDLDSNTTKELLVLTFLKYSGKIVGRKRFQKLIFLAKHTGKIKVPFIFTKHLYGPYSKELQNFLGSLVLTDFVQEEKVNFSGFVEYSYSLTDKGHMILNLLLLTKEDDCMIKEFIDKYKNQPTSRIVSEAYEIAGC